MFDQKAYHKEYRKLNKEKLVSKQLEWHQANPEKKAAYQRNYWKEHRDQINENARKRRKLNPEATKAYEDSYRESTPYRFLTRKFTQLKKEKHRGKKAPRYENHITRGHLWALWDKQKGLCAITGIRMDHKRNTLYTVSIDRIDSSIGYIDGNVQLVCKAINLAKSTYSNAEIIEFWNQARK